MYKHIHPIKQISRFLEWFNSIGINSFDVHIRKPLSKNADYKYGDWIWLTKNENISANDLISRLLQWLRFLNFRGSDIYLRPHKDKKHPVIFLDDVSIKNATMIADKYTSCIVETSVNNTQIWIATDKALDKQLRKKAQEYMLELKFTDPGSISGDHLGRLCGMHSKKRLCWVNLFRCSQKIRYKPKLNTTDKLFPQGGQCALEITNNKKDQSQSAKEFGWVIGMLRNGLKWLVF